MKKLRYARRLAWAMLGTFYRWGGDDPSGFDCSGLCVEILKSVGIILRGSDYSAAGLFSKFKDNRVYELSAGCLVFWTNSSGRIIHVEFCFDSEYTIGASGGGSKTLTEKDAIAQNAYVKFRPVRPGYSYIVNPFKDGI